MELLFTTWRKTREKMKSFYFGTAKYEMLFAIQVEKSNEQGLDIRLAFKVGVWDGDINLEVQ